MGYNKSCLEQQGILTSDQWQWGRKRDVQDCQQRDSSAFDLSLFSNPKTLTLTGRKVTDDVWTLHTFYYFIFWGEKGGKVLGVCILELFRLVLRLFLGHLKCCRSG